LLNHHVRPALVRIEGRHRAGDARGAQPQILLEHDRYDDGLALTIAVAYGGHDEITDAVRALLREAAVDGKALADAIETVPPAAIALILVLTIPRISVLEYK
jgi:mRNA-degrading endonuclease toxin of MazEF toxin-antitoxin module